MNRKTKIPEIGSTITLVWVDTQTLPALDRLVFIKNKEKEIRLGRFNIYNNKFYYYKGSSAIDFWYEAKDVISWAYLAFLSEQ